jgi:hypothetical protein
VKDEQNKPKSVIIVIIFVVGVAAFIGIVLWATTAYLNQQYADAHQGCMPGQTNLKVTIQNNVVTPSNMVGKRCETLTITNLDNIGRLMAFGPHEDHIAYDGIKEQMLTQGQNLTVTLVQTGNFRFHDHIHDEVQGTFTVNN